jgi:hypothetical protein
VGEDCFSGRERGGSMSISAIARIVVSSRRCGNGIVMHCMIFSSLSLAWRVLRKKMEVVAATEASDFVVGSLFALAPCLGFYASTTTDLFSTKRTSERRWQHGSSRCQDMCCCEERCWHACHLFFHVRPFLNHQHHHRAHATPCTSTLAHRTKRVNSV